MEIDLHGETLIDAYEIFTVNYNKCAQSDKDERLKVIHGYGSQGSGGKIKRWLLKFLEDNKDKLSYIEGEKIDGNPGYTIVAAREKLPLASDMMAVEILEYCIQPKTMDKIAGTFRKHGEGKVAECVRKLERNGTLVIEYKGKHKCYKTL